MAFDPYHPYHYDAIHARGEKSIMAEVTTRYSRAVDLGLAPWTGIEPGPPEDWDGARVLLRDGTEAFRVGTYGWKHTGDAVDIIGYQRVRLNRPRATIEGYPPLPGENAFDYGERVHRALLMKLHEKPRVKRKAPWPGVAVLILILGLVGAFILDMLLSHH